MNTSDVLRLLKAAFAAGVVLAVWPAAGQDTVVKKWVDSQGHVHFGDMPPQDAKATEVIIKVTPPSETTPAKPVAKLNADEMERERLDRNAKFDEEERKKQAAAAASAVANGRSAECEKRTAAYQRNLRQTRQPAQGRLMEDPALDKEEIWLAKNCP